ncbi:MAG TPA: FUSC family protein [Thauera aminoaromatica]|nr:FUSC family protein [Thauera aminoaromatica]
MKGGKRRRAARAATRAPRQLQRVLGTAIGMLLAWSLLSLPLDPWRIALLVIALVFVIESLVVRHYGLAVIFITPLTILLAEAATLGAAPLAELIASRFIDTLLGCVVGLVGGICLHSARLREVVGNPMRRLIPRQPPS